MSTISRANACPQPSQPSGWCCARRSVERRPAPWSRWPTTATSLRCWRACPSLYAEPMPSLSSRRIAQRPDERAYAIIARRQSHRRRRPAPSSTTSLPELGYWLGEPFWGQGYAYRGGIAALSRLRARHGSFGGIARPRAGRAITRSLQRAATRAGLSRSARRSRRTDRAPISGKPTTLHACRSSAP